MFRKNSISILIFFILTNSGNAKIQEKLSNNFDRNFVEKQPKRILTNKLNNLDVRTKDKWVVITSINYPTDAIKKLALLSDWQVVVVGDKKTPADWVWPNCIFLSHEKQLELNYRITKFLPWNHYCRKMIGYLYAIQHGAQIIYDTDDDNCLINDSIYYEPKENKVHIVDSNEKIVNPYIYFGQPTVWPRGYPLKKILKNNNCFFHVDRARNLVQQGLADGDPDVDAIFRLTRGQEIIFDQKKSISCKPGVLSPFNSQNTIFYYEAFWGLFLPTTTSFRVCDIWRGYFTQRLLWEMDGALLFIAPTVYQNRNEHDLLKDFIDEIDLYTKSDNLIEFLLSWKPKSTTLYDLIIELTSQMIRNDFYKEAEIDLMNSWLLDLIEIGYIFPETELKAIKAIL